MSGLERMTDVSRTSRSLLQRRAGAVEQGGRCAAWQLKAQHVQNFSFWDGTAPRHAIKTVKRPLR